MAVGLLETRGLADALEGLDAMCKAAAVDLQIFKYTGGGVITVIVKGEVAAVQAAVDAGAAEVLKAGGELLCHYVIASPHPDLQEYLNGEAVVHD